MRVFAALLLSLGAVACNREPKLVERFVEKYCEARWSCGCESPGISQLECESSLTRIGDEAQAAAQEAGLEYDRQCAKAWIDAIDDSCGVQPTPEPNYGNWQPPGCGAPCPAYHGSKHEGEPCEEIGPWSDCASGLVCGVQARCEDPCDGQRQGDVCRHSDYESPCAPGLVCTFDGVCGRAAAIGEPCGECAPGGMCNWRTNRCEAAPGFGEACGEYSPSCGRNLRCTAGDVCDVGPATVCALRPPWGE